MTTEVAAPEARADGRLGEWGPDGARAKVAFLLREFPDRLAHSLCAGEKARRLSGAVSGDDADLLVSAALLHDIGYSSALCRTGFHPLDGAIYLLGAGAPYRLAALVAHHSEARLLAEPAGLLPSLSMFRRERGAVTDALTYADMTAGPDGKPMSLGDRLSDIEARHRDDGSALVAARRHRVPRLRAAAIRTERRLMLSAINLAEAAGAT
jgi:hypothetical protein